MLGLDSEVSAGEPELAAFRASELLLFPRIFSRASLFPKLRGSVHAHRPGSACAPWLPHVTPRRNGCLQDSWEPRLVDMKSPEISMNQSRESRGHCIIHNDRFVNEFVEV